MGYTHDMLTVLIEMADDDADALGATLSHLVPASVEGLVRDVVILDAGIGPHARELAEHSGCSVRPTSELADAIGGARGPWLLLLEPGSHLGRGWMDAVRHRSASAVATSRGARFRHSTSRLMDWIAFRRRPRLSSGLLATRECLARSFRIGMRLADLAAAVPSDPIEVLIERSDRIGFA